MALSQGLYLKQLQKLSPQQIQLMKLLQVPTATNSVNETVAGAYCFAGRAN